MPAPPNTMIRGLRAIEARTRVWPAVAWFCSSMTAPRWASTTGMRVNSPNRRVRSSSGRASLRFPGGAADAFAIASRAAVSPATVMSSFASQWVGRHSIACGGVGMSGVTTTASCANQPAPSSWRTSLSAYMADSACFIGGSDNLCQSPRRSTLYHFPSCLPTPPPFTSTTITTFFHRMTKSASARCL